MIRNFLLADDDEDDTILFNEALKGIDSSIQFGSANNGKELLEKLRSGVHDPQIIFLDINMPEMNGWEALKNLKKEDSFKDIPVIMYSTSSFTLEGKKAIDAGALGYYEKPSNFLKLKEFLELLTASPIAELKSTLKSISSSKFHKIYLG
jgi:CheY-like chemotaxis protein